eukprot:sb/3469881/
MPFLAKSVQKHITAFWHARLGGGGGHLCACQRSDLYVCGDHLCACQRSDIQIKNNPSNVAREKHDEDREEREKRKGFNFIYPSLEESSRTFVPVALSPPPKYGNLSGLLILISFDRKSAVEHEMKLGTVTSIVRKRKAKPEIPNKVMINLMEPGHDPKSQVMQRQWDTLYMTYSGPGKAPRPESNPDSTHPPLQQRGRADRPLIPDDKKTINHNHRYF